MFIQGATKITDQTQGAFRLPPEFIHNFYTVEKDIYTFIEKYKAFDAVNKIKVVAVLTSLLEKSKEELFQSEIKLNIEELMSIVETLQALIVHQMDIQQVPQLDTEEDMEIDLETLDDLLATDDMRFLYQAIMKSSVGLVKSDSYDGKEDVDVLSRLFPVKEKRKELKQLFSYLSKIF